MQIFYIVFELNEYGFLSIEALQYAAAQYFAKPYVQQHTAFYTLKNKDL